MILSTRTARDRVNRGASVYVSFYDAGKKYRVIRFGYKYISTLCNNRFDITQLKNLIYTTN
jgi:hypothetical protein